MYYFILVGSYGVFRSRYGYLDFMFQFAIQRVLFKVFFIKFEWVIELICTYRIDRCFFGLGEGHSLSEFRLHRLLLGHDQVVGDLSGCVPGDIH